MSLANCDRFLLKPQLFDLNPIACSSIARDPKACSLPATASYLNIFDILS
jgi:hypothetical protein